MRVLALEPYYGGSHQAFLDGWRQASQFEWDLLTLPPYKWKWRMRHSALYFAKQLHDCSLEGYDCLFCTDMVNLAELRGLCPRIATVPTVLYFHENQLTYPVRHADERDFHFVLTNLLSGLAADQVWFNSAWHRDNFLEALGPFLRKMPDFQPLDAIETLAARAHVQWPGIDAPSRGAGTQRGPLHLVWAARWEHDKNPDEFFQALRSARAQGGAFRISVLGEQFRNSPDVFQSAQTEFEPWIENWGFQTREAYQRILGEADWFISTATHEYFGLSAAEAIAGGTPALLPNRLAYPELLQACGLESDQHLYDGTPEDLSARLLSLPRQRNDAAAGSALLWSARAAALDAALQQAAQR